MSWKNSVNSALQRVTGLTVTRETPEQRREAIETASKRAARRARAKVAKDHRREIEQLERREAERLKEQAAEIAERHEARREAERIQRQAVAEASKLERQEQGRVRQLEKFDDELRVIVERVREQTMTSLPKLAALVEATRYVVRNEIPGDVVECGVWRGGSMQAVALTLLGTGDVDRELHLFDTFEGMPPPSGDDARTSDGTTVPAQELLATSEKDSDLWAVAGLDVVKQSMADTGYPAGKVHFHPGLVEDTTPGQAPETIAILRLDTDWYASTKHELEHLYDRLSPGGVLILDDYGDWDGARKATDEWLERTGEPIFLAPMGSGRVAIKPWTATRPT